MEKTIIDLPNYIKAAREISLLGGYKKSLETYKKIFRIIDDRLHEVSTDNYLINKWKDTKEQLKKECALILEAYQNCKILNSNVTPQEAKSNQYNDNDNNNFFNRDYKPANYNAKMNDPKRWAHFGGKAPFSYLKERNNNNNNQIYNNYVVENKRNDDLNYLNNFYKDPDVWASPEEDPRFSYDKKYNRPPRPASQKPNNYEKMDLGVVNDKDVEKRRKNYAKPWQVPLYSKPKDPNSSKNNNKFNNKNNKKNNINDKKLNKEPPKSPFLMARYPEDNGNGPDTDLIEMVERDVVDMNPNVNFDDIAELESAKRALTEAVVLPLLMPDFFVGLRRPWKGVLLYGPPGTGKTLLAKALATQGKTTFFNVSPTTFASKWKGESEKLVRILFEMARFYAPSTIFIDEVDSVGTKRTDGENEANKKVLAEMLVQMDGISEANAEENNENNDKEIKPKFVMVMGATNLPWDLDDALRRRFEKRIYISLPNKVGRKQMFHINFKGIKLDKDVNIDELVEKTKGYSGHDIASVCREASLMNMRRKLMSNDGNFNIMEAANNETFIQGLEAPISQKDILTAIKNISKSVSPKDIKKFEEWTQQYSSK